MTVQSLRDGELLRPTGRAHSRSWPIPKSESSTASRSQETQQLESQPYGHSVCLA